MKKLLYIMIMFLLVMFTACGGGGEKEKEAEKPATEEKPKEKEKEKEGSKDTPSKEGEGEGEGAVTDIFTLNDIIFNPAGSAGSKSVMIVSLGFQCEKIEDVERMKTSEVVLRDMILTTFSSKTLDQLSSAGFKDSLKIELLDRLKTEMADIPVKNVYFHKYIFQ